MEWGSGATCPALASFPTLTATAPPRRGTAAGLLSTAPNPLLPGKECLLLPSNAAPCCIATRIPVPSSLSRRAKSDPSPVVLSWPRGSTPAPPAVADASFARLPPSCSFGSHSPAFGHCYSSRATSLKRATKPAPQSPGGVLSSAHAQGGMRPGAGRCPPSPNWVRCCACALLSLSTRLPTKLSHRENSGIGSRSWERKSLAGRKI